jgi:hypothetical protein
VREGLQDLARYSRRGEKVSKILLEDVGDEAAAFGKDRFEEVARFDLRVVGKRGFGGGDDASHARRHENSVPKAIVARPERSPEIRQNIGGTRATGRESIGNTRIVLLDESQ